MTAEEYGAQWISAGCGPEYAIRTYHLPVTPAELRALKHPVYHALLRREIGLMPGAAAALSRLHAHYPLALATNSNRRDVAFVLQHLDLGRFFAAVVVREDYDAAKPAPDAVRAAALRLGTPATRCLVIDDAYRGVAAAHRAGARAVAVPNTFTRGSDFSLAARVLTSLDDLTVDCVRTLMAPAAVSEPPVDPCR